MFGPKSQLIWPRR